MNKKILIVITVLVLLCLSFPQFSLAKSDPGQIYEGNVSLIYRNVTVYAPAVAETGSGLVGVMSTITVTIQSNGSGKVFVDTLPLAQVDMQGSARLAVKVASALVKKDKNCSVDPSSYDYFFVVRTSAPIIGGPSAGAIMTVATISLLENWMMNEKTVMTGMINPDGSIGHVGGIDKKIEAAYTVGATRFLIPKGQGSYVGDNEYGIDVVEVADVNEAVENFTGYHFLSEKSDGEITTKDYIEAFEPLASVLLGKAESLYNKVNDLFNASLSSIPYRDFDWNSYDWIYYQRDIKNRLDYALILKNEAQTWYDQGMYYTSTTKSFLSLISSRFVFYACEFFNTDDVDREEYVSGLIDEVHSFYQEKSRSARNMQIEGMVSLQCVGGAQKRASQANEHLLSANNSFDKGNYYSCIDDLAMAKERSESIGWWLNISSVFNETGDINISDIDSIALEYIEEAQQSIIYSEILLGEMGGTYSYLVDASDLLDDARDEREKGYPAAALFEALEAITKANLEIETIGVNTQKEYREKIEMVNESASSSISKSIKQGIKPVLPVCYYEYGESLLEEDDLTNALFYYRFSGMIAGALGFTNVSAQTSSSRYIGIPEIETRSSVLQNPKFNTSILIILCAGIAGLGIGLIIGSFYSRKQDEEVSHKWAPRSINDYPEKRHYFHKDTMPRSIKDYYKKNK